MSLTVNERPNLQYLTLSPWRTEWAPQTGSIWALTLHPISWQASLMNTWWCHLECHVLMINLNIPLNAFSGGSHAQWIHCCCCWNPHARSLERRQCWVLVVVVAGLWPNFFFTEVLSLNLSFFSRRNRLIATLRVVAGGLKRSSMWKGTAPVT